MAIPNDERTSEAIEILRDAVKTERVPGVVEFGLLDRALAAVREAPTEANLALADAAFRALAEGVRLRVADRALADARFVAEERKEQSSNAVTQIPHPRRRVERDTSGLPPLLRAVNRLRDGKT